MEANDQIKADKNKTTEKIKSRNFNLIYIVTLFLGVLLIFSIYAWFNASLDVKIKTINLVVSKKNGLFVSLDGVNFGSSVEISRENLIENLSSTYPGNTSQWASGGLHPVSSNGIPNPNTEKFDMYYASEFQLDRINRKSYLSTRKSIEQGRADKKSYIAFDLFLKNVTGSPISDNLYIDEGTNIILESEETEQINGLINSVRMGFIKIGSVGLESSTDQIQNMQCDNNCQSIIYEPNSTRHTDLSIQRARKYDINLMNGQYYPTLAIAGEMNSQEISDVIKGNIQSDFQLQITRVDIERPIFELPDGITKMRVYIWLEGQDIDSLETRSEGADISVAINLIKDTAGYDAYDE